MALCNIRKGEVVSLRAPYIPRSSPGTITEKNRTFTSIPKGARGRIVSWEGTDILVSLYRNPSNVGATPVQMRIPIQQFNWVFEPSSTMGWPVLDRISNPADF